MLRVLIATLAMSLVSPVGGRAEFPPEAPAEEHAAVKAAVPVYDREAERELLTLMNQDRQRGGAPPLELDEALTSAARVHALVMAGQQQLSHQLDGEPEVMQRLRNAGARRVIRASENVAYDDCVGDAEEHLMGSAPHRRNLLDARFNIVGLAAIWTGERLWVVQDFGERVREYSRAETERLVENGIRSQRGLAGLHDLARENDPAMGEVACEMAQQGKLQTARILGMGRNRGVLAYAEARPEEFPENHVVADPRLHKFSVGSCGDNAGRVWVAILLH